MYWKPQTPAVESGLVLSGIRYLVGNDMAKLIDRISDLYATGKVSGYSYSCPEPGAGICVVGITTDRPYYKFEITVAPKNTELNIGSMSTARGPTTLQAAVELFELPANIVNIITGFDALIKDILKAPITGGYTRALNKRHVSIYVGEEYRVIVDLKCGYTNDNSKRKAADSIQYGNIESVSVE